MIYTRKHGADIAGIVFYGYIASFTLNHLRPMAKVVANFHVFLAYFQRAFVIINGISSVQEEILIMNGDAGVSVTEEDF